MSFDMFRINEYGNDLMEFRSAFCYYFFLIWLVLAHKKYYIRLLNRYYFFSNVVSAVPLLLL